MKSFRFRTKTVRKAIGFSIALAIASNAAAFNLSGTVFEKVGEKHKVDPLKTSGGRELRIYSSPFEGGLRGMTLGYCIIITPHLRILILLRVTSLYPSSRRETKIYFLH